MRMTLCMCMCMCVWGEGGHLRGAVRGQAFGSPDAAEKAVALFYLENLETAKWVPLRCAGTLRWCLCCTMT